MSGYRGKNLLVIGHFPFVIVIWKGEWHPSGDVVSTTTR